MSSELGELFCVPALNALSRHTPAPIAVRKLLANAATRLIDSTMLLQDSLREFVPPPDSKVKIPLPQSPVLTAIEQSVEMISNEGFGAHAIRFFGLLGSIMIELAGDAAQIRRISAWVGAGLTGAFCMTDRGGPLASQWLSVATMEEVSELVVDKVWAMNACEADFAIVVARRGSSMILLPVILPPEALALSGRSLRTAHFWTICSAW